MVYVSKVHGLTVNTVRTGKGAISSMRMDTVATWIRSTADGIQTRHVVHDWYVYPERCKPTLSHRVPDGTTDDIKLVMKYLASYVDGIFHPTQFIVTGVSLGGHITWNMLAEEPSIAGAIIIVGSPNLTDMLVERLGYASLSDIPQNTKEWPRSIERLYRERDQALEKIVGKKILILNGALDTLVPSKFTDPWVAKYAHQNDVKFIVQEDCGHVLSFRMMEEVVEWVAQILV
ncbi:unnamed protein product [Aspergillus oryzae]|uniref:Unnamed protein product n=1 Tax=Aspergillus oryzae var. brunneus TaxID=332754 RepID=A0ABQ6LA29_ASPOZ|nr:unnamed protein product [Aspergillus oryzae]GMF94073.1 unnamed protein product [Aspergillus oryzae]GMG54937.1 unnamed protein product [Aspergillus oryzae var. brunneus]